MQQVGQLTAKLGVWYTGLGMLDRPPAYILLLL